MASVIHATLPRRRSVPVVGLTPEQFTGWLSGKITHARTAAGVIVKLAPYWAPGQHVALIGRTREGKTNLAVWIMSVRTWKLALDPKGEDDSLSAAAGYIRIKALPPPRRLQNQMAEGKPMALIVGGAARTHKQDLALQTLMSEALDYARYSGGWTLYVDEYQILADQRMYGLGPRVERMLISAARDRTSVITAFQAPAWVPKASTRQATIIICWRTRDRDMIKAVARASGRPYEEIEAALDELPKYHVLVIPDEIRAPMMIVKPPKVT